MSPIRIFTKELFRRKVVRLVGAYLAIFWALVLGLGTLFPVLGVADVVLQIVIYIGVAAIPVVAFIAWKYDFVPPQLVRDIKDLEAENPGLSWARIRHEAKEAGYVILSWTNVDGSRSERRYFQPVAIGREANNDVELGDDRVSRHHAVIWAEDGAWHVRDLDSANGTFVGHTRVAGTMRLPQSCDLRFHIGGPVVGVHVAKTAETIMG